MAIQTKTITLRSRAPLLMNRYAGEQPSMEKAPRGKKTWEWIHKTRREKWMKAAYFANDTFHIPPENIEGMLIQYAARLRKTNDFKEGIAVVEDFIPLIVYSSNEDKRGKQLSGKLEDFYRDEHIDVRGVCMGTGKARVRVDACRPIFRFWGLKFTVQFEDEFLGLDDIKKSLERGALGDFRPRFGRFSFEIA
jgi:hypothetical protein